MQLFSCLFAAVLLVSSVLASLVASPADITAWEQRQDVNLVKRDVWNPPIIHPNTRDCWTLGGQLPEVTWGKSNRPAVVTNLKHGRIQLRTKSANGAINWVPIATEVDLDQGHWKVQLPVYLKEGVYQIALLGDSGNISEEFRIGGCKKFEAELEEWEKGLTREISKETKDFRDIFTERIPDRV